MSSKFKVGDVIHYLSDRSYYDHNNQYVSLKGKPVIGVVTGYDKEERAVVKWQDPNLSGMSETAYNNSDQFTIWNGSDEKKLIRRKTLVTRKKKKNKLKIGTLVTIRVVDYDSDKYDRFHPHRNKPTKTATGIIINEDGLEMYFEIYLQESMQSVWREYDEIRRV